MKAGNTPSVPSHTPPDGRDEGGSKVTDPSLMGTLTSDVPLVSVFVRSYCNKDTCNADTQLCRFDVCIKV